MSPGSQTPWTARAPANGRQGLSGHGEARWHGRTPQLTSWLPGRVPEQAAKGDTVKRSGRGQSRLVWAWRGEARPGAARTGPARRGEAQQARRRAEPAPAVL